MLEAVQCTAIAAIITTEGELTHRVVEQLLQLLVGVVDAQLLKAVQLEDFETSDVKDANEAGTLPFGSIKRPVDPGDNPFEEALVGGLGDGFNGKLHLLLRLGFGHIISSDLDPRFKERLGQVRHLDAQQVSDLQQINQKSVFFYRIQFDSRFEKLTF